MRIGLLCHDSFGGSTRVATELASGLANSGHCVHLFSHSPPFGQSIDQPGLTLHTVESARVDDRHAANLYTDWSETEINALARTVIELVKSEGLDILHFHYAVPYVDVLAEVRRHLGSNCPVTVGTLHGTDVTAHGYLPETKRPRFIALLSETDALTTVSMSHAKLAAEMFDLPSLPMVIPNFVDLVRYSPNDMNGASRQGSSTSATPKIIHISNFRPVKRVDDVVRIFYGVRQRIEAELWLVGDGEAMTDAKRFLDANGLTDSVRFWGLRPDITQILPQADLLLVTSQYESFCLVALEAMACGVPVLASDVGGLPELFAASDAGTLFPVGECDVAVETASELLVAPKRRQVMSDAGRRRAEAYSSGDVITLYEDLYRDLLESS